MRERNPSNGDRGQAYTLEGLISAMVVLMAVLFALQSAVITPTTGGLNDRTVQAQVQQEVQDALVVAANNESGEGLSYMARHWNTTDGSFENASGPRVDGNRTYEASEDDDYFTEEFTLGDILYERFGENGQNYNVEAHYEDGDANRTHKTLVYQGSPPSGAVTASYTVTLYDKEYVTGDVSDDDTLDNASEDETPTIDHIGDDNGPIYNVVEIRVIVW